MPILLINLQIVLCFTYTTNALLSLVLAVSGRNFRGAWWWVLGQSLLAFGTFTDALPPAVPQWLPLIAGNSAYAISSIAYSRSVWEFRHTKPFPRWAFIVLLLVIFSFVLTYHQPYLVRALVFSAWMAIGPLCTGLILLWRVERQHLLSHCFTALPFLFLGVASVWRSITLAIMLVQNDHSSMGEINVWYVTGAILLSTITLFGYFMMTATKSQRELRQKDEEIEARNRELINAAHSKDLFFAIVAHDLRGPIGGAARYVRKHLFGKMSGLDAKHTEVETLASSLEKTNEFLENLLWWSRAQMLDWTPRREPIQLGKLLADAVALVQAQAEAKSIPIILEALPRSDLFSDRESVLIILHNLLSNAVKYSTPGKPITIIVSVQDSTIKLTVSDQGIGMDQTTLTRLFRVENKFSTLGTSDERGSGLGLILARSLAERNLGGITLESQPSIGTRATLWLPALPDTALS